MQSAATRSEVTTSQLFRDLPVLADVFRIAFEQSAAGISVAAPSGEYLHANGAFCDFVGYSLEQVRTLRTTDLMHQDDRRLASDLGDRMLRGEISEARWERRYIHKSGLPLWAVLTTTLVRDEKGEPAYFISQVIDITDRKLAEEALQRAEARARALIGAMQVVIIVLDREGPYVVIAASANERQ